MDDGDETIQKSEVRVVFVRSLVYGLWNWSHIHIPVLASSRLRRYSHSFWSCFRHQPRFGNIRLLLQFQIDQTNWTCQSIVPWTYSEHSQVSIHIMGDKSLVGITVRIHAGRKTKSIFLGVDESLFMNLVMNVKILCYPLVAKNGSNLINRMKYSRILKNSLT